MTKRKNLSGFKAHRFPSDIIEYAVWLYFRFSLSLRDVEDLLAERVMGRFKLSRHVQQFLSAHDQINAYNSGGPIHMINPEVWQAAN